MINQKEASILAYLIKRSPNDKYIVIEPSEIIDNVSEKLDKDELVRLLNDLSGREAINVRILNMDECVLAPTPKARVLIEELKEIEETKSIISSAKTQEIEPTIEVKNDSTKSKFSFRQKAEKPQITKVVIDYKKIFWSAFTGALCGGGIIAIIMLIINVAA